MAKFLAAITFLACVFSYEIAAGQIKEPRIDPKWVEEVAPFRIAGNLYYVGTKDVCCYLITTPQGNVLINTGVASSFDVIRRNISQLGFRIEDLKILLCSQAHYDHLGGMAAMKKASGAKFWVEEHDAQVVSDGGSSDYEMGKHGMTFEPIKVDSLLHDGAVISLGGTGIKLLHHGGHTKGSSSFIFTVADSARQYRVLIANMPSVIVDGKIKDVKNYHEMEADYRHTFQSLKEQRFDLWFAAHDSQCHINTKHRPGDPYNPEAFRDPKGFAKELKELEADFRSHL
jgi:metallo-beta-lactamase class B